MLAPEDDDDILNNKLNNIKTIICFNINMISCKQNYNELSFNDKLFFSQGIILLHDNNTKKQYKINFPGNPESIKSWIGLICTSQGFSYYYTNNKIILVTMPKEHLSYITNAYQPDNYFLVREIHEKNGKKEYYTSSDFIYKDIVYEIECTEYTAYDYLTIDVDNINDPFELKCIIHKLREKINSKIDKK